MYSVGEMWNVRKLRAPTNQECNARKVNCSRVYSSYILKPVLLYIRGSSGIRGGRKHLILIIYIIVSYGQNISSIIFVKMDSCSLWLPCLLFCQRQYTTVKKCVHLWNKFTCISTLFLSIYSSMDLLYFNLSIDLYTGIISIHRDNIYIQG